MKINFIKVLRELKVYKGRTLMAFMGILIGVASIGFVLSAYSILVREMNRNFMDTNPASIVMKVRNLDPGGMELVKKAQKNIDVEARKTLQARMGRGNGLKGTIYLFAVQDFNKLKVDTFALEEGYFPKNMSQMAMERDSLKILGNLKKGYDEKISVQLPGGNQANMYLSGRVHAPSLAPASMEKYAYAFLTMEGMHKLGYQGWFDEIHLVSYDNRFDRNKLKSMASELKEKLVQKGYIVDRIDVPIPGKHPHGDQLKSLLFLLQAFAVISLFVACIIIVNLLNFIMSRQTKQIAIMKAYGANTFDIALPYFLYVLIISIAAIVVSFPISTILGCGYSTFAAGILNFNITSYYIPLWVLFLQISIGLVIPILSSLYPIFKSCRIPVKDGLSEQQNSRNSSSGKKSVLQKLLYNASTKITIPVNNVFRKKGRTLLSILALATGGILFITSQNIVASIGTTVDKSTRIFAFDYDVRLYGQYAEDKLEKTLGTLNNVKSAEVYHSGAASFKKSDGTASSNYLVRVLPQNTSMVNFKFLKGSKHASSDNSIFVNKALLDEENWLKLGMKVRMEIGGKSAIATVDGIVNELPPIPGIYLNADSYKKYYDNLSKQNLFISAKTQDQQEQIQISKDLEKSFNTAGIEIAENWNINLLRKSFVEHLKVIVNFLSVISLLAVLVGGLSIASAISINMNERKREFGILRATGVSGSQLVKMISLEVILMGLAGWFVGLLFAYPLSIYAGNYFGQIFLHSNLDTTLSVSGTAIWFVISILVSFISGTLPARMTANSTLREMLSYE